MYERNIALPDEWRELIAAAAERDHITSLNEWMRQAIREKLERAASAAALLEIEQRQAKTLLTVLDSQQALFAQFVEFAKLAFWCLPEPRGADAIQQQRDLAMKRYEQMMQGAAKLLAAPESKHAAA